MYFLHVNALGSESQATDATGGGGQGILYYPWGQVWVNGTGAYGTYQTYASLLLYDPETSGYQTPFRQYVSPQGRRQNPPRAT